MWFTPEVVPITYTQNVRFEATVTESPASVAFEYNGVDRPMYDDGTHGDRVAGDGIWTTLFPANEILSNLTPSWVYRPFIGYCKPAGSGLRYNIFAEIWTPDMGLVDVESLGPDVQQTDYLVNFTATTNQLMNFDAAYWANRFYALYGDKFDFLEFLHIAGERGNRYHFSVRNDVQGIGLNLFNNSAQYGSPGRLKGCTVYPLSSFFDFGETAFSHETGHQWINFLSGTPFGSGIPHWPEGDVAINVMGYSLPGGVGGRYYYTFTPNSLGGFVVGSGNETNAQVFNSMELYLMGLVPPADVGTFFVLNNQNLDLTVGQTLLPSDVTLVTVTNVIAAFGQRLPTSANAQKVFRCATVVLSEQLLDAYAMSFYDWFARRGEAKQRLSYASGFSTGTCNPFYLATGGRAVMFSKLKDDRPSLSISRLPNGDCNLTFTGKPGIQYQPQVSSNLVTWLSQGPPVTVPQTQPLGDASVSVTVNPASGTLRFFYRIACEY
jgi:hypothetical protein